LIRIDVPGSEPPPVPERGVAFTSFPLSTGAIEARFVGPAAVVDAGLPGYALLFLATANAPTPGTAVVADCRTADLPEIGVEIPGAALLHHGGRQFVFVDRGAGTFERRAVETVTREDGSLFVSKGLTPGELIVIAGAEQLFSAERLGATAGAAE
jgi:multidrug efflux pump subunit AcrA (membrane-fusion protein)